MTIIIQSGWTKGRGRYAQPQRHHGASQSQFAGRTSAIFGADSFARVQGYGGCQTTTGHRTSPFRIADVSSLGGVVAGALSVIGARPRPFLEFVGRIYRAVRTRFPVLVHSAPTVRQNSARRTFEQLFHSSSATPFQRSQNSDWGFAACAKNFSRKCIKS